MNNISLPVAELKPALQGLGKIISKRPTLPVLSMVKVERTTEGWITITGTNLDSFVTAHMEEPAEGDPVQILVPYDDLNRIAKSCSNGEALVIEKAKGDKALIQYPIGNQTGEEHVDSLPVAEYPAIPKITASPVSIDADVRCSLLQAFDCASTDPARYVLNGAYIDVSDKKCHAIVGTDGRRHLYCSNSFTLPLKESLIIHTNKFLGWKQFVNDGEWQMRVEQLNSMGYVQISTRRYRFITKSVEGAFPNWRHVVPGKFNTTVEFTDESPLGIISRLPVDSRDTNNTIGLIIERNTVRIQARGGVDEKPVEAEVTGVIVHGSPGTIHLNRQFMVKALEYGFNKLEITDEKSAMRFIKDGRQIIVMPLRGSETSPRQSPAKTPTPSSAPVAPSSDAAASQQQERKTTMPRTTTPAATTPANGTTDKASIESALEKIDSIKGSYREAIQGLNQLSETLKQVQRDQKTANKEVQSVRSTLEKLQSVKI